MIRFSCPHCHKVLKTADEGVGRKISCPRCGQRLLIPSPIPVPDKTMLGKPLPPVSTTSNLALAPTGSSRRVGYWGVPNARIASGTIVAICMLGCFLVIGILSGVFLLVRVVPSPVDTEAAEPATCKELVERVQSNGLEIEWVHRARGGIVVGRPNSLGLLQFTQRAASDPSFHHTEEHALGVTLHVIIEQLPTAQQAKEHAGEMPNAISHGRFLIYGSDVDLIRGIKNALR